MTAGRQESGSWHTLAVDQVLQEQDSGTDGLGSDEAARRLEQFGPNEFEAERETRWWASPSPDRIVRLIFVAFAKQLTTHRGT